ncbi:MAG: hypothetical protein N3G76_03185, partial [Candidatus Micrarchaeota archaeon]|nr:hypothetical protein [Candidatus Micrarchaeota archaeon]
MLMSSAESQQPQAKKERVNAFVDKIGSFFPDLRKKLRIAKMQKGQEVYIRDVIVYTALVSVTLFLIYLLVFITA